LDFYEIGVYLVIVLVASTSVFGVMWLLIRSMTPKRRKPRRGAALLKAGAEVKPARNAKKKNGNGKSKGKKDELPELKEYPESKMLPVGNEKGKKGKAEDDKHSSQKPGDEKKEKEKVLAAAAAGSAGAAGAATAGKDGTRQETANQEGTAQEGGEIALPDLPSMDTLTEGEEEMPKEELDLMSVFQSEDSEDSTTSDLAANLFDVDVGNIEKLGSEVSQFLSGMR
jgi:hypothetical protein